MRTRAIPERLRGVFTTRPYRNPRLPLPLPSTTDASLLGFGFFHYSEILRSHFSTRERYPIVTTERSQKIIHNLSKDVAQRPSTVTSSFTGTSLVL